MTTNIFMTLIILGMVDALGKPRIALFDPLEKGIGVVTPHTVKRLMALGVEVVGVDNRKPLKVHACNRFGRPCVRRESLKWADTTHLRTAKEIISDGIPMSEGQKATKKATSEKISAAARKRKIAAEKEARMRREKVLRCLHVTKPSALMKLIQIREINLDDSHYLVASPGKVPVWVDWRIATSQWRISPKLRFRKGRDFFSFQWDEKRFSYRLIKASRALEWTEERELEGIIKEMFAHHGLAVNEDNVPIQFRLGKAK